MAEQKYVVFKLKDFDRMLDSVDGNGYSDDYELNDAVVIRLKDRFAGPALHAYASAVQNAIEILGELGVETEVIDDLTALRQTFWEFAIDADNHSAKRLPD